MKALRVLVIVLLATFGYQVVNAQQVPHHKRHHSIKPNHHHRI